MSFFKMEHGIIEINEGQEFLIQDSWAELTASEVEQALAPTEEQRKEQAKLEAQGYLNSTDWIMTKYQEVVSINGTMTKEEFITKYSEELQKREEARVIINS